MNVTVIVKHSRDASWEDSLQIYSCSTGFEPDPLPATALFTGEETRAIAIAEWLDWATFYEIVQSYSPPVTTEATVDVSLYSFPRRRKKNSSIAIKQSALAQEFLTSIAKFIPRLRENLSGVWIRVD